jgi:hypothetical protein
MLFNEHCLMLHRFKIVSKLFKIALWTEEGWIEIKKLKLKLARFNNKV